MQFSLSSSNSKVSPQFLSLIMSIGIRALSDLGGGRGEGGEFLARKIYAIPECGLLKSGYKRTQIARKTNSFTISRVAENFSWEFNFSDFGFFRFCRKKNREIGFRTLLMGITFREIHVQSI